MDKTGRTRKRLNWSDNSSIWVATIFLCAFGLLVIYSSSGINCLENNMYKNDSMYLFRHQLAYMLLGFGICFAGQYIPYTLLRPCAKVIYLLGIGIIFLLRTPLGVSVKGATRWLNIGGIQFQVAEIVKICVIVILAYMAERFVDKLEQWQLTVLMWTVGGIAALLLFSISNDLSSSIVVLGITFGITFVYTANWKLHVGVMAFVAVIVGVYVLGIWRDMPTPEELESLPFRVGRIAAWLDPERYATQQGYQTLQALYAIGRGGFWGEGLGNSIQKLSAIPEAQNDMIFSIICEELGVFGAGVLLLLFVLLLWELYKVIISVKNLFGAVLVTGVLLHIGLQAFINIAVNVNFFPNTGIGLPFISYGGTAVFCQLAEIAIVLSVGHVPKSESFSESDT